MTTIYHNPRCSKSRQTLQLLRDQGIEPKIVTYLDTPPDAKTLQSLLKKLSLRAKDIVRRKEEPFKTLKLADKLEDDGALIRAMVKHPVLIERPIVVHGAKACLGRPPENILDLF